LIQYKQEFLCTCLEEFKPMLVKHWEEIAINKDTIKLNPDYDKYYALEDLGMLKVFTARDEGKPVGYILFLVDSNMHYQDTIWAKMDIFYVNPEHRNARVAVRLIKFAEDCLKQDGVDVIMIGTKSHKPFDRLLEFLGYSEVEKYYGKKV